MRPVLHAMVAFSSGILILGVVFVAWSAAELYHYRVDGTYRLRLPAIAGYAEHYSHERGEAVSLRLHAARPGHARLYRLGSGREDVGVAFSVAVDEQPSVFDLDTGMGWRETHALGTADLDSGAYLLELETTEGPAASFRVPILVRPRAPPAIAVVLSTHTWDAYNSFGGVSNYDNRLFSAPVGVAVKLIKKLVGEPHFLEDHLPYARPNANISDEMAGATDPYSPYTTRFLRNEWALIAFLERQGYAYGVYADEDLEPGGGAWQSDVLVLAGHSEYWTGGMLHALDGYLAEGGRVLAPASGKPIAEPVRLRAEGKEYPAEPFPSSLTARRLGIAFSPADMYSAAPYRVEAPEHWVFAGTGLAAGDLFGRRSAYRAEPWIDFWTSYRNPTGGMGASGVFMSKVHAAGGPVRILARGQNAEGGGHMVYRDTPAGGWVFASGSEAFNGALGDDPVVQGIVANLLDEATGWRRHGRRLAAPTGHGDRSAD